ncbi:D-alanyl-D-alanine carboxypeptidase/D-alanyl-D-alanine endopeptidase [Mucisphaera sp.]|uniref:D-alanyl-D-alanine carboxypeptidase/D-alanyl-D-alanine endopeptidase n=1 Tax=Mucisphaera sp. TaxID=2913024 RepID=UPI003D113732
MFERVSGWGLSRGLRLGLVMGVVGLLGGVCSSAAASVEELRARIGVILNGVDQADITVAARVVDLETGRVIYEQNADRPVKPASNLKLLVTAAALDKWGSGARLATDLYVAGDDLVVVGTGDPAFGDLTIMQDQGRTMLAGFDDWVDALKERGITEIKGDLVYNDGALGDEWLSPTWSRGNLVHWYGAPSAGLNLNNNCIDIVVEPIEGREDGVGRVSYLPEAAMIRVENRTGGEGRLRVDKVPGEHVYIVTGKVERTRTFYKPVDDPGRFFAEALMAHLARRGIDVRGGIVAGSELAGAYTRLGRHETDVVPVLRRINSNSQNMMADGVLRMIFPGQTYQEAGLGLVAYLEEVKGLPVGGVEVWDGSGLSHDNRVTTGFVSELLVTMAGHEEAGVYYDSLAIAGERGSLRNRMKAVAGKVQGKTGTISGVRASSGYIETEEGRRVVYSLIYNDIASGKAGAAIGAMDEVCVLIQGWEAWD